LKRIDLAGAFSLSGESYESGFKTSFGNCKSLADIAMLQRLHRRRFSRLICDTSRIKQGDAMPMDTFTILLQQHIEV
jgi:hypothetical protein